MSSFVVIIFVLTSIIRNSIQASLVEIPITNKSQLYEVSKLKLTICNVTDNYIQVISTPEELQILKNLGYTPKIILEDYTKPVKEILAKGNYHTYAEIMQELDSIAVNFSGIALLDTLGYSAGGRLILGLKISDNPSVEEDEPGIRFTGCHHGDEVISSEIVIRLIEYLIDKYSTDSMVKDFVDMRQIWLIPIVNPDGMYTVSRYNANNIDLNRDYGYMWDGWGNSTKPFSQPETRALKLNAEKHRFALSFDYHSVATYLNCLWDYTHTRPQVDTIMLNIGKEYIDSTGYSMIHGYDWYQVCGSSQDAISGCEGTIGYTIESPQPADPTTVYEANIRAILEMIKRAGDRGIAGKITDSATGAPLDARLEIVGINWYVYTNKNTGFYNIILLPGTYTLKVSANGYAGKTISNITVNNSVVPENVILTPSLTDSYWANKIVWVKYAGDSNQTLTSSAIGPQDSTFFSIGTAGQIVLDMGIPIIDSFTIYEGNNGVPSESYQVLISDSWPDSFISLGTGTGTTTFDITSTGLEEARYVKLIDDGNDSNHRYPGFDLDAIKSYRVFGVNETPASLPDITISSNPVVSNLIVKIGGKNGEKSLLRLYNLAGQLMVEQTIGNNLPFTIPANKLTNNVYFLKLQGNGWATTRKLVVLPARRPAGGH